MANPQKICPIWGTPVENIVEKADRVIVVLSYRAGGTYSIDRDSLERNLPEWLDDIQKTRLTTHLANRRKQGEECPHITKDMLYPGNWTKSKPWQDRLNDALLYIVSQTEWPYDQMPFNNQLGLAHNPLTPSPNEADRHSCMVTVEMEAISAWHARNGMQPLIDSEMIKDDLNALSPTVAGYLKAEELRRIPPRKRCFIAMWFDPSVVALYDDAIKPAVEQAGYEPVIINRKADIPGKIEDEIVAELRRTNLAIVDFTHGTDGARGSVY